jgi:hypothetical protein
MIAQGRSCVVGPPILRVMFGQQLSPPPVPDFQVETSIHRTMNFPEAAVVAPPGCADMMRRLAAVFGCCQVWDR